MSDFIIQIGEMLAPEQVAERLRDRPGMKDRPVIVRRFSWGTAVIQPPPCQGYQPFEENGILLACTGRPRIIGVSHEESGDNGFCRELAQAIEHCPVTELPPSITGMFALAILHSDGFRIATDMLGSQPIYKAESGTNGKLCIGTNADIVTEIVGHRNEIDLVSIGEFLVYDQISFPFTTYQRTREMDPAAVHQWHFGDGSCLASSHVYWQPSEPKIWPRRNDIADELESALRLAAEEISRGTHKLAIPLSGGRDSRTVLALMRATGIEAALTYCTRENRETDVATQVAKLAGVRHLLVRREPHFYGKVLERTMALIGSEVRGEAHGFAVFDAQLAKQFDVIVGGYLSDTLLKDHFMPLAQREQLRKKTFRERMTSLFRAQNTRPMPGTRWAASRDMLCPEIRDQVESRRRERLAQIARIRPESAEEWQGFWPISRQHDVGSAWANNRLFCADELFYFRQVLEVATRMSPEDRYSGTVAHLTFNRLCGPLNSMINANTGVAASADNGEEGKFFKKLRRTGRLDEFRSLPASNAPWNDVQHSWADPVKLLLHSPDWQRYRENISRSNANDVLRSILSTESCDMLTRYEPGGDPRASMALIQAGMHIMGSLATPS
jgi:asparagine synthetase B (glutamine-hydrolysing)